MHKAESAGILYTELMFAVSAEMLSLVLSSLRSLTPSVLQLYRYHSFAFPHLHRRGHAIPLPDEFSGPWPPPSSLLQRHVLRIAPSAGSVQPGLLHEQLWHHGARPQGKFSPADTRESSSHPLGFTFTCEVSMTVHVGHTLRVCHRVIEAVVVYHDICFFSTDSPRNSS